MASGAARECPAKTLTAGSDTGQRGVAVAGANPQGAPSRPGEPSDSSRRAAHEWTGTFHA